MAQMRSSTPIPMVDPLDLTDYDPVKHLNLLFPHPATLSAVPAVANQLHNHVSSLDSQIASLVLAQAASSRENLERISRARKDLAELFEKIEGVNERARATEEGIASMTGEIKRLDMTKRNLTVSMTVLKRLQMLTTAYEQLRTLGKTRQYRECASLLLAVLQLMAHFKSYRSIDQIATLNRNVAELERELLEQVCEDFELAFTKAEIPQKGTMLAEACLVMDALGEAARTRLINWYCNTQLREYRTVFRGSEEAGSLDNISRRYAWLKRILKTYDEEHAAIFPQAWRVNEVLATTFCENTKDDFRGILGRTGRSGARGVDVNLLLGCLQETMEFETWLDKKFAANHVGERRTSLDTTSSKEGAGFAKSISGAFEPYLSLWVDAQDRQLSALISKYRSNPLSQTDEEITSTSVLPSSIDLFHFYRRTFSQCATLSTGQALADLAQTFTKHLDSYATDVLSYLLTQPISTLETVVILNTADYCATTSLQLGQKIASQLSPPLAQHITFESQQDAFLSVASSVIRSLVAQSDAPLDPALREMRNMPWARLSSVGDTSAYVGEMIRVATTCATNVLPLLTKETYARAYTERLAEAFSSAFLNSVLSLRPVPEIAAEQLLLDLYSLKAHFSTLLHISPLFPAPKEKPSGGDSTLPAAHVRHITAIFARPTGLLKALQLPADNPVAFAQGFLLHHPTRSRAALTTLLTLKSIRTAAHPAYLEALAAHIAEMPEADRARLSGEEYWLAVAGAAAGTESGRGEKEEKKGLSFLERMERMGEREEGRGLGRFFGRDR